MDWMDRSSPPSYPDEDRGPLLQRTTWSLIGISALVVALRLWTKASKARRLYADDICMAFALLFGLVHAALLDEAISHGLGKHMVYLTIDGRENTLKLGLIGLGWGYLSPMAGRVAFCVTMLYVAGTDRGVHRWAKFTTWTFIVLQLVINLLAIIVFYAQCGTNLDIFWDLSRIHLAPGYCLPTSVQTVLVYIQGTFNCLTDAYLTVLPAILIEHSKLSLKRKLGLACLLCLSVLALAAAIVKAYEAKALREVADYSYELCDYVIWMAVELNVVIIVASVPFLRPLLTVFQRRHHRLPDEQTPGWEITTLNSVVSKTKPRTRTQTVSTSSQENIVPHSSEIFSLEPRGITVTHEVSVTYHASEVQFVHAALVGLVQGELANPSLAQR